jgi:hypothetical protein
VRSPRSNGTSGCASGSDAVAISGFAVASALLGKLESSPSSYCSSGCAAGSVAVAISGFAVA